MVPFNSFVDFATGEILKCRSVVIRRVSDMDGMYRDRHATQRLVQEGDPVVYKVYNVPVPEERGHLQHCVSVIYPGKVAEEYFMTKGHFHAERGTGEVYLVIRGEGILLLQTEKGEVMVLEMKPGSISYIPPHWAHRTVNVGKDPLVFFAVYPGEAGHDYGEIERRGFAKLVVERAGKPEVIDNPNYKVG